MPCTYDGPDNHETWTKLKQVTQLLCFLVEHLPQYELGKVTSLPKPEATLLREWVDEHRAADERRKKREAAEVAKRKAKAAALAKLTAEERRALGI